MRPTEWMAAIRRTSRRSGGYSVVDTVVVLFIISVMLGMGVPIGRRALARYQLNNAAQTLQSEIERAKVRAIQTNRTATVRLESARYYRAAGYPQSLPGAIRFAEESADSVSFNSLGAVADGAARRFLLVTPYGDGWEILVYAAGGQEARRI